MNLTASNVFSVVVISDIFFQPSSTYDFISNRCISFWQQAGGCFLVSCLSSTSAAYPHGRAGTIAPV